MGDMRVRYVYYGNRSILCVIKMYNTYRVTEINRRKINKELLANNKVRAVFGYLSIEYCLRHFPYFLITPIEFNKLKENNRISDNKIMVDHNWSDYEYIKSTKLLCVR